MTQSEYARTRRLARSTVVRQIRAGQIHVDKDGMLDPRQADKDRAANLDGTRKRQQAARKGGHNNTLAAIQTEREMIKLRRDQMSEARIEGRLVDAEKVREQVFTRARSERDALMAWPSRLAQVMAAELSVDPKLLHGVLDRHIRAFLLERSGAADGIDS